MNNITTSVWLQPAFPAQRQHNDWSDTWNKPVQEYLLSQLLNDVEAFKQCRHILRDEFFDDTLARGVRFILKHYDQTGALPDRKLIYAKTGAEIRQGVEGIDLPEVEPTERDWLLTNIEDFCRFKGIESTVLEAIDLLCQGKDAEIEERIREARAFSITRTNGRFPRLTASDFTNITYSDWLIPGLLFEKQIGMMYGEPGSLKSFIALSIASMLAHGMEWRGKELQRRRVLYVAGEGAAMMPLRRLAWYKHHDIDMKADGHDVIPVSVNLTDDADVTIFITEMQRDCENMGLIVFDTLSTCIVGKNDSAVEVATAAIENGKRIARVLDCAALFVHHPGKDTSRGARGSSAFLGNVDTMWRVERSDMRATVRVEKQKDGEEETASFVAHRVMTGVFDSYGNERSSLVVVETGAEVPGEAISTRQADLADIAALLRNGDRLTLTQCAKHVCEALQCKERSAIDRIKEAVPETWTRVKLATGYVELRRDVVNTNKQFVEVRLVADVE